MMTLTITILLLAFLLVFVKTSESKSLSSMQMVKYNYKNRKNTNLIKRSENSNGGGNEVVMCNDHNECPVGFACLLPGFEMSNSKANKKCYQCNCTDLSQCFFQDKQMKCDCCGSGFTGPFCEINIDDCIKAVCLNGATCEDFVNDYTCHCTPGFTGTHCEIGPCLPGWTHYRSSCYLFVSEAFNWQSAVYHCKSLHTNAYLVEITDKAENTLVDSIASDAKVWIGLSDRSSEGTFYWENSGNILTYKPGNYLQYKGFASRDCVIMHDINTAYTHWDVDLCTRNWPIVCEMPEQ